jgi:hypothetical protein
MATISPSPYGAGAGAGIAMVSNFLSMGANNRSIINQIKRNGDLLAIETRAINQNHEQLDRELGDILSANAMSTAKNMATASVMMSMSGTTGGSTAQVSKQARIDQLKTEADIIAQARNSDIALLNKQLSAQINFRNQADSVRSQMASPLEALMGSISAGVSGASSGMQFEKNLTDALPKNFNFGDSIFKMFGTTTQLPSINYQQ